VAWSDIANAEAEASNRSFTVMLAYRRDRDSEGRLRFGADFFFHVPILSELVLNTGKFELDEKSVFKRKAIKACRCVVIEIDDDSPGAVPGARLALDYLQWTRGFIQSARRQLDQKK
jgi:hypothetical protein